jgi:hypothetical protein
MEGTVKPRLLLTSALFLFVQMPTMQAQETLDLAKVTCEQLQGEKLAYISRDIMLVLVGYYNGKRNNTIIEPQTVKKHAPRGAGGNRETTAGSTPPARALPP